MATLLMNWWLVSPMAGELTVRIMPSLLQAPGAIDASTVSWSAKPRCSRPVAFSPSTPFRMSGVSVKFATRPGIAPVASGIGPALYPVRSISYCGSVAVRHSPLAKLCARLIC